MFKIAFVSSKSDPHALREAGLDKVGRTPSSARDPLIALSNGSVSVVNREAE